VITSTFLFYCLLLLARYVKQTKSAPVDADFEVLLQEKQALLQQSDQVAQDLVNAQTQIKSLEEELKKTQELVQSKSAEVESLKKNKAA